MNGIVLCVESLCWIYDGHVNMSSVFLYTNHLCVVGENSRWGVDKGAGALFTTKINEEDYEV